MTQIHILDDHLISQIAAGEVVERPASVIKELVENSIDAGAKDVRVELEVGGKRRIVIADDGSGMDADDALLAFDRHATSKIAAFDDLEQVATLGFRGEALASIAAVARVELRTAVAPGDGHLVRIEGGRVRSVEPTSHPRGTRLEVASLFFNVPARRKFTKRPQTELRRSMEVVQGYALAHPEVRFQVDHEGRTLLEATPVEDDGEGVRQRIGQIFGRDAGRQLQEIPLEFVGEEEAISGFVGRQGAGRGRRSFVFVNRRLVRDRQIMARFYRAVRDTWKSEDYPSLYLFIDLPPQEVDVNVHPQKAEVRFRDPYFVDRIEDALRATLELARGEEAAPLRMPQGPLPASPAWEGLGSAGGVGTAAGALQGTFGDLSAGGAADAAIAYDASPAAPSEIAEPGSERRWPTGEAGGAAPPSQIAHASVAPPRPTMVPLSGRSGEARPFRILGQYKGTMILLEGPDGLYLIDQHVAHERLLYERLRRNMAESRPASQQLLQPILMELAGSEAMRLEELGPALEECGFGVDRLSGNTVALRSVPVVLSAEAGEAIVQRLATGGGEEVSDVTHLRRRLLDDLAADMSCKGAIKMHHPLTMEEMQRLVTELFQAEQPYACPHGRPVVLQMTDVELERRFGRR